MKINWLCYSNLFYLLLLLLCEFLHFLESLLTKPLRGSGELWDENQYDCKVYFKEALHGPGDVIRVIGAWA